MRLSLAFATALFLAGCGQSGSLYLPEPPSHPAVPASTLGAATPASAPAVPASR
ncbi:MAG: lipoprotein [Gammaproteobacteria bacterium]|nr:lipoprotein [Gammaproteobacteria bacterium]